MQRCVFFRVTASDVLGEGQSDVSLGEPAAIDIGRNVHLHFKSSGKLESQPPEQSLPLRASTSTPQVDSAAQISYGRSPCRSSNHRADKTARYFRLRARDLVRQTANPM